MRASVERNPSLVARTIRDPGAWKRSTNVTSPRESVVWVDPAKVTRASRTASTAPGARHGR